MNDPNGPIFHSGLWHLFFQHLDIKHWGHAVSRDLIHWEIWPIALSPVELGEIWSGSVVFDGNNTSGFFPDSGGGLVAIFTLRTPEAQSQGLAFSHDDGRTWTHDSQNPVLADRTSPDFRDPKVFWHAPSGRWVMVLAAGAEIRLYASSTLKDWHLLSTIGRETLPPDVICECPDLFEMAFSDVVDQPRWVLNVSLIKDDSVTGGTRDHRTYHSCGDFDGTIFTPSGSLQQTSYGPDDYACMTFAETGTRRIWVGWMSNWAYASRARFGDVRGGPMTLARELSLARSGSTWKLVQAPATEILDLFADTTALSNVPIPEGIHRQPGIPKMGAYVIDFVLEPGEVSRCGVRIDNCLNIGYDNVTKEVYLHREDSKLTRGWPGFAGKWTSETPLVDHTVKMQIFLDQGCVEVFVDGGTAYFAAITFPDLSHKGLEFFSEGGTARFSELFIRKRAQN